MTGTSLLCTWLVAFPKLESGRVKFKPLTPRKIIEAASLSLTLEAMSQFRELQGTELAYRTDQVPRDEDRLDRLIMQREA